MARVGQRNSPRGTMMPMGLIEVIVTVGLLVATAAAGTFRPTNGVLEFSGEVSDTQVKLEDIDHTVIYFRRGCSVKSVLPQDPYQNATFVFEPGSKVTGTARLSDSGAPATDLTVRADGATLHYLFIRYAQGALKFNFMGGTVFRSNSGFTSGDTGMLLKNCRGTTAVTFEASDAHFGSGGLIFDQCATSGSRVVLRRCNMTNAQVGLVDSHWTEALISLEHIRSAGDSVPFDSTAFGDALVRFTKSHFDKSNLQVFDVTAEGTKKVETFLGLKESFLRQGSSIRLERVIGSYRESTFTIPLRIHDTMVTSASIVIRDSIFAARAATYGSMGLQLVDTTITERSTLSVENVTFDVTASDSSSGSSRVCGCVAFNGGDVLENSVLRLDGVTCTAAAKQLLTHGVRLVRASMVGGAMVIHASNITATSNDLDAAAYPIAVEDSKITRSTMSITDNRLFVEAIDAPRGAVTIFSTTTSSDGKLESSRVDVLRNVMKVVANDTSGGRSAVVEVETATTSSASTVVFADNDMIGVSAKRNRIGRVCGGSFSRVAFLRNTITARAPSDAAMDMVAKCPRSTSVTRFELVANIGPCDESKTVGMLRTAVASSTTRLCDFSLLRTNDLRTQHMNSFGAFYVSCNFIRTTPTGALTHLTRVDTSVSPLSKLGEFNSAARTEAACTACPDRLCTTPSDEGLDTLLSAAASPTCTGACVCPSTFSSGRAQWPTCDSGATTPPPTPTTAMPSTTAPPALPPATPAPTLFPPACQPLYTIVSQPQSTSCSTVQPSSDWHCDNVHDVYPTVADIGTEFDAGKGAAKEWSNNPDAESTAWLTYSYTTQQSFNSVCFQQRVHHCDVVTTIEVFIGGGEGNTATASRVHRFTPSRTSMLLCYALPGVYTTNSVTFFLAKTDVSGCQLYTGGSTVALAYDRVCGVATTTAAPTTTTPPPTTTTTTTTTTPAPTPVPTTPAPTTTPVPTPVPTTANLTMPPLVTSTAPPLTAPPTPAPTPGPPTPPPPSATRPATPSRSIPMTGTRVPTPSMLPTDTRTASPSPSRSGRTGSGTATVSRTIAITASEPETSSQSQAASSTATQELSDSVSSSLFPDPYLVASPPEIAQSAVMGEDNSIPLDRQVTLAIFGTTLDLAALEVPGAVEVGEYRRELARRLNVSLTAGTRQATAGFRANRGAMLPEATLVRHANETHVIIEFGVAPGYYARHDEFLDITIPAEVLAHRRASASVTAVRLVKPERAGISPSLKASAEAVAVSSAGVSGATAMNGAAAAQAARANLLLSIQECEFDPDEEPGWMEYPLGIPIGTSEYRFHIGGMLFNPALLIAFSALHAALAVALFLLISCIRTRRGGDPGPKGAYWVCTAAFGQFLFPSFEFLLLMFYLQPSITFAMRVAISGNGADDWTSVVWRSTAIGLLLFWVAATVALAIKMTARFGADWRVDEPPEDALSVSWAAHVFFLGTGTWEDSVFTNVRHAHFSRMYGTVFNAYRIGRQWFAGVEMVISIMAGVASAITPSDGDCSVVGIVLTAVFGLYLLAVIALRPYMTTLDSIVGFVLAAAMFVSALLVTLVAAGAVENDRLGTESARLTVSGMYVLGVKAIVDMCVFSYETVQEMREKRAYRKRVEKEALLEEATRKADELVASRKLYAAEEKGRLLAELRDEPPAFMSGGSGAHQVPTEPLLAGQGGALLWTHAPDQPAKQQPLLPPRHAAAAAGGGVAALAAYPSTEVAGQQRSRRGTAAVRLPRAVRRIRDERLVPSSSAGAATRSASSSSADEDAIAARRRNNRKRKQQQQPPSGSAAVPQHPPARGRRGALNPAMWDLL